jgi:hypothetical protein
MRKKAYGGDVASVKIGAKLLIPESEIERLIQEGMRPRRVGGRINEARTEINATRFLCPNREVTSKHARNFPKAGWRAYPASAWL